MVTGLSKEDRVVKRYSVLVLILGLVLTIFITHLVYKGQKQLSDSNFEFLAQNQAENIKERAPEWVPFLSLPAIVYEA